MFRRGNDDNTRLRMENQDEFSYFHSSPGTRFDPEWGQETANLHQYKSGTQGAKGIKNATMSPTHGFQTAEVNTEYFCEG
jgi:hypothetical protein